LQYSAGGHGWLGSEKEIQCIPDGEIAQKPVKCDV
jgi:hypothetical protein